MMAAKIAERLDLALEVRQRLYRVEEIINSIEALVTDIGSMAAERRVTLAEVLSQEEIAEMDALWNLAASFVSDARAAAPTLLAPQVPYHAPAEDLLGGV